MTTTLQYLVSELQSRTNQENNSNVSQIDCINWINYSIARLYDLLIHTYKDYDCHTYFCTLNGSAPMFNLIPITSDMSVVRQVEFQYLNGGSGVNADNYIPLPQFSMSTRNQFGTMPAAIGLPWTVGNLTYRVMGQNIQIEPIQSCAGSYRIWYQQKYQPLVNLTDVLPPILDNNAWYQYGVCDAATKVCGKVGLDASLFIEERNILKVEIESYASYRDQSGIIRTRNTRRRGRQFGLGGGGMGSMF